MAIVKNTRNSDTAITLRVFRKNTNIKSLIPDAGQYVTAMYPKYYLQLNNSALGDASGVGMMPRIWSFRAGDGFIIRAEISANASGSFWGGVSTDNNSLSIVKNGNAIMWVVNGDAIASVTYQSGIHDYGFTGFEVNGVKYSQAYYDGAVVSDSSPENFSDVFPITLIGGFFVPNEDPECIHGSDYGIRVYDAIADTSEGSWHLYPYNQVDSASGGGMFETLNKNGGERCKRTSHGTSAGGTSSVSVGEFPSDISGIGIQLPEDLRAITGSGYFDLIPLIFEDGGIDTWVGWNSSLADTNPSKVSESGQPDKYFAFYIGLSANNTNIPLPDGCTATKAGTTNYEIGQLIKGRRPKWSIWNDGVTWGKYTVSENGVRYLVFNTLKNVNGTYLADVEKDLLGMFEGYNTAANRPPKFSIASAFAAEFHNAICCICKPDNKLVGPNNKECQQIFKYDVDALFAGSINIGNLAPWNLSAAELAQSNLLIFGASVTVEDVVGQTVTVFAKFMEKGTEQHEFNSASTTDKTKFRDGDIIPDRLSFNKDVLNILYARALDHQGSFQCTAQLGLIGLNDSDIKTERIVPAKSVTLNVTFEHNYLDVYTNTLHYNNKDRFLIGEDGGKCTLGGNTYDINIMSDSVKDSLWQDFDILYHYTDASKHLGYGIGCAIALWNGTSLANIVDNLVAFIEVTLVKEDGTFYGRYAAFTRPISLLGQYSSGGVPPYYEQPYNIEGGTPQFGLDDRQRMNVWPSGIRVTRSDFSTTRACMWRWKDLYHTASDTTATNERPKIQVNNSTISIPMTSRIRLFENTTTNKGPVAWAFRYDFSSNSGWSSRHGIPFRRVKYNGTRYLLAPVMTEPVVQYNTETINDEVYTKVVDCWLTINNDNGSQVTTLDYLPSDFGVVLYETILHAPHERSGEYQLSTEGDINPEVVATIALDDTDFHASGNYGMRVSGKQHYMGSALLYGGDVVCNEDGFYHLECWIKTANYKSGAYYQLDFLTEPL